MIGKTRCLTRSALGAAVGVICLLLCTVLPTAKLALLCLSSLGVCFVRMSCSVKWAIGTYLITAALALLLLPEKSPAAAYALLTGFYPLILLRLERIGKKSLRYGIKLLLFNAVFAGLYFAVSGLLPAKASALSPWILFIAANIAFLVYDYALTQLILLYIRKIARRIHEWPNFTA